MLANSNARKRPTNVSLGEAVVNEAKSLGVNISQACEAGLTAEVDRIRKARWLEEHQGAFETWNEHVRENGLPLEKYRMF